MYVGTREIRFILDKKKKSRFWDFFYFFYFMKLSKKSKLSKYAEISVSEGIFSRSVLSRVNFYSEGLDYVCITDVTAH